MYMNTETDTRNTYLSLPSPEASWLCYPELGMLRVRVFICMNLNVARLPEPKGQLWPHGPYCGQRQYAKGEHKLPTRR